MAQIIRTSAQSQIRASLLGSSSFLSPHPNLLSSFSLTQSPPPTSSLLPPSPPSSPFPSVSSSPNPFLNFKTLKRRSPSPFPIATLLLPQRRHETLSLPRRPKYSLLHHSRVSLMRNPSSMKREFDSRKEEEGEKGIEWRRESSSCEAVVAAHGGGVEDVWRRQQGRKSWAAREAAAVAAERSAADIG
ncbi:hypothetical protein Droror1_Dr00023615 [Drosera rotundifolia]